MAKVKLTVTESSCRRGYHKKGDVFLAEDLCPPLCHGLWNTYIRWYMPCRTARNWITAMFARKRSTANALTAAE